jgi:carbon-monoxide dehydrogenase medium subunit
MTIQGSHGSRTVPAAEFFLGVYMTAVGVGEVLTKIKIPAGRNDGFAAVTLGVEGTCIVSAAASLNGGLTLALGCVDAVPVVLTPGSADDDAIRAAVREADLDPPSDVHASSDYRKHLAEVLAVRAARQAQGS